MPDANKNPYLSVLTIQTIEFGTITNRAVQELLRKLRKTDVARAADRFQFPTMLDLFRFARGSAASAEYESFVLSQGKDISPEVARFCRNGTLGTCKNGRCGKPVKVARFFKVSGGERLHYCTAACFVHMWGDAESSDVALASRRGSAPARPAGYELPNRFKEETQRAGW